MVAATHALVFAAIYYFTHRMVLMNLEGFVGARPLTREVKAPLIQNGQFVV